MSPTPFPRAKPHWRVNKKKIFNTHCYIYNFKETVQILNKKKNLLLIKYV